MEKVKLYHRTLFSEKERITMKPSLILVSVIGIALILLGLVSNFQFPQLSIRDYVLLSFLATIVGLALFFERGKEE